MLLFQNDPFRDVDTAFERLASRSRGPGAIPMDAYRRGDDVWVHLDLPGVSSDSIDVTLERNVLTVTATREWSRHEDDRLYVSERRAGTFRRQVHLGESLDSDAIEADHHDGVLTLRIPIAEKAQPRKISVGSAGLTAIDVASADAS